MKEEVLHLVLCYKWYDMIASGIKHEEYRDLKWLKRLQNHHYTKVCFHRGYTATTQTFDILDIRRGIGAHKDWGAPDYEVLIIHFR